MKSVIGKSPLTPPKYSKTLQNGVTVCDPRATRSTVALMNQNAIIGGAAAHWGGPSAFAEINSALFGIFFESKDHDWARDYNFVNDAGHTENGLYALHANYGFNNLCFSDLKKFRSVSSKLTGHGEAHLYPEGVLISNGPLGSALPQAQGLAAADKLLKNKRVTITTLSDGAAMEGEAKESFAAIPGLAKSGKLNPFVLIISDNNTKLSGRIDGSSFSMSPTFSSLKDLGWNVTEVMDGHNIDLVHETLVDSIAAAKENPSSPIALVVKTIKGKSVKSTEESASGGHGHPLKASNSGIRDFIQEIYGDESIPAEFQEWISEIEDIENKSKDASGSNHEKIQKGIGPALEELFEEGIPLVSVTSDLAGSTGVAPFQKNHPDHTFDVGVAESNMVSMAAGLSKQGFVPIVDTFAQFGVTKGNLPLAMANQSEAPIIAFFSHTGFQDAADGASHQATTYMSSTMNIPNTRVFNCSCSSQINSLIKREIRHFWQMKKEGKTPDSIIFFLGRENFAPDHGAKDLELSVLTEGSDAVLCPIGSMVPQALAAAEMLKKEGINVSVIDHYQVNTFNSQKYEEFIKKNNNLIVTIEDHQVSGGAGVYLRGELSNSLKFKHLGISGKFGRSAYSANELYALHGIDAQAIAEVTKKFIDSEV